MKKLAIIILLLALSLPFAFAQTAVSTPNYQVTFLNQEPDPVEPGEIVELRLQIENTGDVISENTLVQITPTFPLLAYGTTTKNIGTLHSSQASSDLQIVDFKLRVDPSAVEGPARFEVMVSTSQGGQTFNFTADILTRDAVLAVDDILTQPSVVIPGEEAKISFKLTNLADTILKDIRLTLDLSSDTLPLVPSGSSTEKRVPQITSNESAWITFGLRAQPDATAKSYKIPFTLTYYDNIGTKYEKTSYAGITINSDSELLVEVSKKDTYLPGTKGTITLEIANAGLVDVKFLTLTIKEHDGYVLLSPSQIYIGDVDSDDIESEELTLFIKKNAKSNITLPVTLRYRDANNKIHEETRTVPLTLYSKSDAKRYGLVPSSILGTLIVLLIALAAGGYLLYRWKFTQQKK